MTWVSGILLVALVLIYGGGGYLLWRNRLVYNYLIAVLDRGDLETYRRLPSYEKMLFQLWRFNWKNYERGEHARPGQ